MTFRQLTHRSAEDNFAPGGSLHDWHLRWTQRLESRESDQAESAQDNAATSQELMSKSNPAIIPRNHQVEAVISAAVEEKDYEPFHKLLDAVTQPYSESHDGGVYAAAPAEDEVVTATFCGT